MTKIMGAVILTLVIIFAYTVSYTMAQEMIEKKGGTSDVSELLGKGVKTPKGEDLGRITDLVAGPEGRVAFAVLSYWVSADTQMRVAVPFSTLSCGEQDCVLNISKEKLDSAPNFVLRDELVEPRLAEDIYRYFGIQPYWTEGGTHD